MQDDSTPSDESPRDDDDAADQIGPYRMRHLLGEGGMGRVFLADEKHPARQVALKLVSGLSAQARARFQREIEALAQLEHPAVARLYAAGSSQFRGVEQAWFSMEYVAGDDLTEHIQRQKPDLPQRLQLLVKVGRGVHYAHGRGVIHRDLKPSNILVDADGQPKILDFGIARLRDDAAASLTQAGQVLGTLPYVAPEQLGGAPNAVGVRSDVYSLGVIAYEMLGGVLPHPRLGTSTLFEALQILRDEIPLPLASHSNAARGDLDTVVMKALASEPTQRYASVGDFVDDLQRVIEHRPIHARPPTWRYRCARFVRRHRALSIAAAVVFVILAGATLVSLQFAWSAQQSRLEAEQRAAESAAVNAFLERMLASADPEQTRGVALTVSDVVGQAERELEGLANQPRVRRSLLSTLASTRRSLGDYEHALKLNDDALALYDADAQPAPQQRAQALRLRASLLTELSRFDEARSAITQAREAWPQATADARLGMDLTATRIDDEAGKVDDAERGYRAIIATASSIADAGGESASPLDIARSNLSGVLRDRGALEEAETLIRVVLQARQDAHGARDPRTLSARHKLALILAARGNPEQAESEATAVLSLQREVLGDDHASTLTTMQTLANIDVTQGKLDAAEALTREAMTGFERQFGEAHAQTLATMNTLAYLLEERKQVDAAEAQYRRILAIQQRTGNDHPSALAPRNNLAMLLMGAGKLDAARIEFEALIDHARRSVGTDHAMTMIFSSNYGLCLDRLGRIADARAVLEPSHARLLQLMGPEHQRTRMAAERLADVYAHLGLADQAARMRPPKAP